MAIEKPSEKDKRLKPAQIFQFDGKEFTMVFDEYQKYKNRRQKNVVLSRLLRLFEIPIHKYCLPGDRKPRREHFSESA